MHYSRLVGGLAALAALLILLAAPAAWRRVADARLVRRLRDARQRRLQRGGHGPGRRGVRGRVRPGATATGAGGRLLLVKYVDTGATHDREWSRTFSRSGTAPRRRAKVAVDAVGRRDRCRHAGRRPSLTRQGQRHRRAQGLARRQAPLEGDVRRAAHRDDYVNDLALDADGNALVVGASAGRGTGRDYVTLKLRAGRHPRLGAAATPDPDGVRRGARRRRRSEGQRVRHRLVQRQEPRATRAHHLLQPGRGEAVGARDTTRRSWSGAADVMLSSAAPARRCRHHRVPGRPHGGDESPHVRQVLAPRTARSSGSGSLPNGAQATEPACRRPSTARRAGRGRDDQPDVRASAATSPASPRAVATPGTARWSASSPIPAKHEFDAVAVSAARRRPGRRLDAGGQAGEAAVGLHPDRVRRPLQCGMADHGAARLHRSRKRDDAEQVHGGRDRRGRHVRGRRADRRSRRSGRGARQVLRTAKTESPRPRGSQRVARPSSARSPRRSGRRGRRRSA